MGRIDEWYEAEDLKAMDLAYKLMNPGVSHSIAQSFMSDISWRLYTEWCLNTPWEKHNGYTGEGFTDWVRDETHHYFERLGYRWDHNEKRFDNLSPNEYNNARQGILSAVVKCAVEFFKTDGVNRKDSVNLRKPLKPWIDNPIKS